MILVGLIILLHMKAGPCPLSLLVMLWTSIFANPPLFWQLMVEANYYILKIFGNLYFSNSSLNAINYCRSDWPTLENIINDYGSNRVHFGLYQPGHKHTLRNLICNYWSTPGDEQRWRQDMPWKQREEKRDGASFCRQAGQLEWFSSSLIKQGQYRNHGWLHVNLRRAVGNIDWKSGVFPSRREIFFGKKH